MSRFKDILTIKHLHVIYLTVNLVAHSALFIVWTGFALVYLEIVELL